MPKLPGMQGDVYFGMTNELPDWRKHPHPNPDEDPTEKERQIAVKKLGFDPRKWNEDEEEDEEEDAEDETAAR